MSPTSFLQRPLRWLQAISDHGASVSGAPNFAYEHCVNKTTPQQRAKLDLSYWKVAFCSAEPVRADTLARFGEAFEPGGFNLDAFYPCYGLAEATLLAAGGEGPARPVVKHVSRDALTRHRYVDTKGKGKSQPLVGCGRALLDQQIVITDPESRLPLQGDRVGEIWLKGPSVARGYWNRRDETQEVFEARLADGDGPYLRTGDLGVIADGHLFITGRMKDLIIIRGRNHYPQDIEKTVESAHGALLYGAGAAFSVEFDGSERLVVVHEIDRHQKGADLQQVIREVRAAVADAHELEVFGVALIRQVSLPRTTSGKPQRSLCRDRFLAGELKTLADWSAESNGEAVLGGENTVAKDVTRQRNGSRARQSLDSAEIEAPHNQTLASSATQRDSPLDEFEIDRLAGRVECWLNNWLVDRAGVPQSEVSRERPFAEYGLDSLKAVELSLELEDWLGVELSPVIAWKYPTPEKMSRYLARQSSGATQQSESFVGLQRRHNVAEFQRLLEEIEEMGEPEAERRLDEGARS